MGICGRVALTVLAAFVFWIAVKCIAGRAYIPHLPLPKPVRPAETGIDSNVTKDETRAPWPSYPGASESTPGEMTLNGIRIIDEEWNAAASALDIIGYYRARMSERGWKDVTEDSFGLRPEARADSGASAGLQDPAYVRTYLRVTGSCLVMCRGEWTVQIMTEPAYGGKGRCHVRLCAAETPALRGFIESMSSALNGGTGTQKKRRLLQAGETHAGSSYDTAITLVRGAPEAAFINAIEELLRDEWLLSMTTDGRSGDRQFLGILRKGEEIGCLVVQKAPGEGNDSSVVFTRITGDTAI